MTLPVRMSAPNRSACLRIVPHQVGTAHAVRMSREILDVGGRRQLSARFDAFVKHRFEVGARGVDGGGVPCEAAADDQDLTCSSMVSVVVCMFQSLFVPNSSGVVPGVEFRPSRNNPHRTMLSAT